MIPDVAAWASNSAGQKDRNTDYTENSRQAMADMARTTLENSINIPPTVHKNQGEIINLVTGQDIDFSGIYTLRMKMTAKNISWTAISSDFWRFSGASRTDGDRR